MYLGKSEFETGNETRKWKFHTDQLLLGEEPVIELWIDFGTSEVGEKIVINGLSEIFNKQTLCDVKFKFKNSEEIGAHVAILTAGSPVFAAMLKSNFVESKSRIVNIADIEMDVFKEMLVHLYTGKAPNLLEINFTRSVYEVADKYGVKSLKDDCENLLVSQLSNSNAIELLIWAQFHSQPKLIKKAILFIVKNSEEFCFQADCEEIGAHVAILTAGSPVFAAMLQPDFLESKTRIVNIEDSEMDVFKEMLVHLYTGKAPNLMEMNFTQSVFEVADKYGVKSLKDDCVNLLVSQLSNDNAMELLVWAQFRSQAKLIEKAIHFIVKNSKDLCSQAEWLDFMKDHPNLCVEINQRMAKRITIGYDNGCHSD
ncbi:hypothetical protein DAPPUDRAFT_199215 [Daphnia pulex]|uniref:BTB domain-containing protein n=1 Tax=Daphnia pulex TaxID=6669 RepID=E9GXV8_DAPPU|nr:hypothetical protein DAPPUDRAFT_199215 [Daphnia pulex]|eukprot:EFX75747.1 hypothetical protein DAPPUDRAFT_199215 [Daphnia pulex]